MIRIDPSSAAGEFLLNQGVSADLLTKTTFRVLNWQTGDAVTVVKPSGRATVFMKSRFVETDESGEIPVSRRLSLIRHELHHVQQGAEWGFIGYWAKHLWARVRHLSISAKNSSVEAPAYELQRKARAALDEIISSGTP